MAEETITYTRRVKQRITASQCDKLLMCHYTRAGDNSGGKCSQRRSFDSPGPHRSHAKGTPTAGRSENDAHIVQRGTDADQLMPADPQNDKINSPTNALEKSTGKRRSSTSSAHPAPPTDASYKTPTAGGWSGRRRTDATATGPNHEDPGNRISGVNNEVEKNNEAEHKEASADCAPRSSRGMSHDLHPVVEFKKDGSSQEDASIIHVVGFDFDSTPYASLSPEEGAGYGSWGTGGSKRVTRRSISMSPLVSANRYFQEVDAEQLEEETPVRGNAAAASGDSPSPGPGLTRQGEACNARQPGDTGVEASQGEGTSDQQQQQLQQGGGRGRRPRRSWRSPNVTAMYPTLTLEYDKYRETMANLLPAELQLSPVPLAEFCRNISISKLGSPVIYPGLLD